MTIDSANSISVTVVMPIRNEGAFIRQSLGAVLSQDYPSALLEVLIADGMSTDETRPIIKEVSRQQPDIALRVIDNPERIVATGLNRVIELATGDVIIRVDGHTIIERDYVRQCVEGIKRSGADNVGGRMDAVSESAFGRAVALATSTRFGVGGSKFHYSQVEEQVDTVYMGAWKRDVFDRIGNFDEELVRNQDDELNYRLRSFGGRIVLCPDIRSKYFNRTTLRSLWRQYYQYGFWKVRVMQKHPGQIRLSHLVPSAFVLTLLTGSLLAVVTPLALASFVGMVAVYFLFAVLASLPSLLKNDLKSVLLMPITFPVLHLGYGSGFLVGLVRFRSRWSSRMQAAAS